MGPVVHINQCFIGLISKCGYALRQLITTSRIVPRETSFGSHTSTSENEEGNEEGGEGGDINLIEKPCAQVPPAVRFRWKWAPGR